MERIKLKAEQPKTEAQPFLYYFASSFVNDGVLPAPEAVFCNSFAFAHKAEAAFFMKPHACGVVFKYNRAKAPDSRLFAFFAKAHRVTAIIRTRQKCSIKAIFVAFAVDLRHKEPLSALRRSSPLWASASYLTFLSLIFSLSGGKSPKLAPIG